MELADDVTLLDGRPFPLCQVKDLDTAQAWVTVQPDDDRLSQILKICEREMRHPLLRRWEDDVKATSAVMGTANDSTDGWLPLENGILDPL